MDIIPAIDVLDGGVVRLLRGAYDDVTVYADDPVAQARSWSASGVPIVHVVDLDAARGRPRDLRTLHRLGAAGITFQVGGGIRTAPDAEEAIGAGAARVVVGSAFTATDGRPEAIVEAVGAERVVAAIDVRHGRARGSGWLDEGSSLPEVLGRLDAAGVDRALVTGIERDGTLDGPDEGLLAEVRALAPALRLIASGGVGTLDDLRRLAHSPSGIEAAIVGRALYEGRFDLTEAVAVARG